MSYEFPIETQENDVLVVAIQDNEGSYFMWQKGLTEDVGSEDGIYFEFNDQINGGHNIVKECTIDRDGIHVVFSDSKLEHFYFPQGFNKYDDLKKGLLKIYEGIDGILEFNEI